MPFALIGPAGKNGPRDSGTIIEETFSYTSVDVWYSAFDYFCKHGLGPLHASHYDGMEMEACAPGKSVYFQRRFWKRLEPFKAFAKRHGYSVVPVRLVVDTRHGAKS